MHFPSASVFFSAGAGKSGSSLVSFGNRLFCSAQKTTNRHRRRHTHPQGSVSGLVAAVRPAAGSSLPSPVRPVRPRRGNRTRAAFARAARAPLGVGSLVLVSCTVPPTETQRHTVKSAVFVWWAALVGWPCSSTARPTRSPPRRALFAFWPSAPFPALGACSACLLHSILLLCTHDRLPPFCRARRCCRFSPRLALWRGPVRRRRGAGWGPCAHRLRVRRGPRRRLRCCCCWCPCYPRACAGGLAHPRPGVPRGGRRRPLPARARHPYPAGGPARRRRGRVPARWWCWCAWPWLAARAAPGGAPWGAGVRGWSGRPGWCGLVGCGCGRCGWLAAAARAHAVLVGLYTRTPPHLGGVFA